MSPRSSASRGVSAPMIQAEENLRRAYGSAKADTRVRQNLGLVVGLQGRFAEAETIVKADLPAEEAATRDDCVFASNTSSHIGNPGWFAVEFTD